MNDMISEIQNFLFSFTAVFISEIEISFAIAHDESFKLNKTVNAAVYVN